jgi:CHAT domain
LPEGRRGLFDLGLAHELYDTLIGPVEGLIRDKHHLIVVPSVALTALPFHLLLTQTPAVAVPQLNAPRDLAFYRDAQWLLKRHAVSVLPSVASLKALRGFARKDEAKQPLIGFGDPVFNADEESRPAAQQRRVVATRSYAEFWQGVDIDRAMLSKALPRLPETTAELRAASCRAKSWRACKRHQAAQGRERSERQARAATTASFISPRMVSLPAR